LNGILVSSFLIAFSGAVMPGPVLTVTITESAKRGFLAGPLIILGHAVLESALVLLIVLGLADFMQRPAWIGTIGLAGCVLLLWLSFGMIKGLRDATMDLAPGKGSPGGPILAGILTSLANPYWTVWWATIGLGYVVMSMKFGMVGVFIFFVGHISADLAWYSVVSYLVSRGKRRFSNHVYRVTVGFCALVLILFAFYFGLQGLRYLL
jgi:threonine/homoserine/homoserine lactone efflux protein